MFPRLIMVRSRQDCNKGRKVQIPGRWKMQQEFLLLTTICSSMLMRFYISYHHSDRLVPLLG